MRLTVLTVLICMLMALMVVACESGSTISPSPTIVDAPTVMPVPSPTQNSDESVQVLNQETPFAELIDPPDPTRIPTDTSTPTPTNTPTETPTPTNTPWPEQVAVLKTDTYVNCTTTDCYRNYYSEEQVVLEDGRYVIERQGDLGCRVSIDSGSGSYSLSDLQPVFDKWLDTGIYTWYTHDENCTFILYKYWNTEKPIPTPTPILESYDDVWETMQGVGWDHVCYDFADQQIKDPSKLGNPIHGSQSHIAQKFNSYNGLAKRHGLEEITDGEFWVILYERCQDYVPLAVEATTTAVQASNERQIWDVLLAPDTRYPQFKEEYCPLYRGVQDPPQEWLDQLLEEFRTAESSGAVTQYRYPEDFRFTIEGYHEAFSRNCLMR